MAPQSAVATLGKRASTRERSQQIGFVFQSYNLLDGHSAQNPVRWREIIAYRELMAAAVARAKDLVG